MVTNVLRIIGVVNILFINFTEIYSVTADWSNNVGGWLWVILALSFTRELVSIFATKIENLPRVVRGMIRSITMFAAGCASSIAFIFPKLVYLESNYKDSIEISKFKIKIVRNYSIDELYDYLNTISVSNPLPVPIKMKIAESASNRAQVRDLYEEQVELMRQLSEPVVVRPMHDLEVILNWCDEHTLYVQIGVAVAIAALIVGFGYYIYTHPHVDYRDAAESLLEKSSGDTRDAIDNLRQVQREGNNLLGQLQNVVQKAESKLGTSSVSRDIYEKINGLKEECKKLSDAIDTNSIIQDTELEGISERLKALDQKIDGVNEKALEFHSNTILDNAVRFTDLTEKVDSLEERICTDFDSDTNITDDFSKQLDKLILSVKDLQEHVTQHDTSLESITTQILELSKKASDRDVSMGAIINEHSEMLRILTKNMKAVTERASSLCALFVRALTEDDALDKYKDFAEVYKKLGKQLLRVDPNSGPEPNYVQDLKRAFIGSIRLASKGKKEDG